MKFTATAKGPGLTLMVCVGLQSMIDACLEWGEKLREGDSDGHLTLTELVKFYGDKPTPIE